MAALLCLAVVVHNMLLGRAQDIADDMEALVGCELRAKLVEVNEVPAGPCTAAACCGC